jgi:hypothetical protein
MCHNREMKRVLYQGPTNIRRHHKKFSLLGDLSASVSAMLYYTHYDMEALPSFHGTASNTYHSMFYILTLQGIHKMYITIIPVIILNAITIRYNHTRILPRNSANRERKTVKFQHDEGMTNPTPIYIKTSHVSIHKLRHTILPIYGHVAMQYMPWSLRLQLLRSFYQFHLSTVTGLKSPYYEQQTVLHRNHTTQDILNSPQTETFQTEVSICYKRRIQSYSEHTYTTTYVP